MMKHYACDGECGGVSHKNDSCGSENCTKKGQEFKECNCEEKTHFAKAEESKKKDEEVKEEE